MMVGHEGEKRRFVVKKVGHKKSVDPTVSIAEFAADEFFDRMKKRPDVARLMRKLSKS